MVSELDHGGAWASGGMDGRVWGAGVDSLGSQGFGFAVLTGSANLASTAAPSAAITPPAPLPPPDDFVWCSVPLSAQDAFLFVGLALLVMSTLFGKLSAVWVLIAGTTASDGLGALMLPVIGPACCDGAGACIDTLSGPASSLVGSWACLPRRLTWRRGAGHDPKCSQPCHSATTFCRRHCRHHQLASELGPDFQCHQHMVRGLEGGVPVCA